MRPKGKLGHCLGKNELKNIRYSKEKGTSGGKTENNTVMEITVLRNYDLTLYKALRPKQKKNHSFSRTKEVNKDVDLCASMRSDKSLRT